MLRQLSRRLAPRLIQHPILLRTFTHTPTVNLPRVSNKVSTEVLEPVEYPLADTLRHTTVGVLETRLPQKEVPSGERQLLNHLHTSFLPTYQSIDSSDNDTSASALALVTPFEGGEVYIREAVENVAATLDAVVLRINLPLAVGFQGERSTLLKTPPSLPPSVNAVYWEPPEEVEVEADPNEEDVPRGFIKVPLTVVTQTASPTETVAEEWISYFDEMLKSSTGKRRIILLEGASSMSASFEVWWASFLEAVKRRRRATTGRGKKSLQLVNPISVVLSCAPSLLPAHAAPRGEPHSDEKRESMRNVAEAIASKLGWGVASIHDSRDDKNLWYGGDESDVAGREWRDRCRIKALAHKGARSLLPAFKAEKPASSLPPPLLSLIRQSSSLSQTFIRQTLPILSSDREKDLEARERLEIRRSLNIAILSEAVAASGGCLVEVPEVSSTTPAWVSQAVLRWSEAQLLAQSSLGNAVSLTASMKDKSPISVTLPMIDETSLHMIEEEDVLKQHLSTLVPAPTPLRPASETDHPQTSRKFTAYEKRLLPCVVDVAKLKSASFANVHLPEKTIDAVKTLVSLPLLYPNAFQGGVLKDHSTGGALLFGPPGTGKTLLARAVASESGANMLAIQPSDVHDMYYGEGEKLVKAVFSLARQLSPCVVFIDEVDALFSSRSSSDMGGGKHHNVLLTEFMQEMDGLNSADSNRDHRVVVIGATNRPFDLDDAVLRRLPRRVLVDLPDAKDRQAILGILLKDEILNEDLDVAKLAAQTEGYSGSDLKHLCVNAALTAVKELVKVPWRNNDATETIQDVAEPKRVLSKAHFDVALKEIRPSSTEEGTLPALRRWAEQYGEGGKAQGKRKGFGKGFGFGNVPVDPLTGYGKVVQDEA